MQTDRYGQPITTASPQALELYDVTIERLFALQPGGDVLIDQALALDPEFALALCAKARTLMMAGEAAAGRAAAKRAQDLAERLCPRERSHATIVCMVLHGESPTGALQAVREHAAAYPRDPVPLSFALGVYGLLGFGGYRDFTARQVALLRSVAPAWGDDSWFLAATATTNRVPPPKARRSSTPGCRATVAWRRCTDTWRGIRHCSRCSAAMSNVPYRYIGTTSLLRRRRRSPCSR